MSLIAILEPRQKGDKAEQMRRRLGFDEVAIIESVGFSGGIWVFWEKEAEFEVVEKHEQVLHGIIKRGTSNECGLSIIYGSPQVQRRRELWRQLERVDNFGVARWCFCGDFNATLNYDDRLSNARNVAPPDKWFREWVSDSCLKEIQAAGPKFTWARKGCYSKIDWVLMNEECLLKFPEASAVHLPKFKSDHCPILLRMEGGRIKIRRRKEFRFFAPWVTHDDFNEVVKRSWVESRNWHENVMSFVGNVQEWNKEVFGNVNQRKRSLLRKLDSINRKFERLQFDSSIEGERENVWGQLEEVLAQEEIMWLQRSRCSWYNEGDKNTRYFHYMANSRKKRNRIEALKGDDGEWEYDPMKIRQIGTSFFTSLYMDDNDVMPKVNFGYRFPELSKADIQSIGRRISLEEVKRALFAMGPM